MNYCTGFGYLIERFTEGDDKSIKDFVLSLIFVFVFILTFAKISSVMIASVLAVVIGLRMVNIVCVQIKVPFQWWPGDPKKLKKKELTAYRRSAILLVMNICEVIFGYMIIYANLQNDFTIDKPGYAGSWFSYLHGSIYHMFGAGKDLVSWKTELGQFVITTQNIIGWGFMVLSLAVFIGLLGDFRTRDKDEKSS